MKPVAWPEGYDRRILARVDSTLSEAARIAPALSRPTWILGLEQTAGRGRRGRAWSDPPGNLAATLVLKPVEPPGQAALRSFVAALAVLEACEATTQASGLQLKWPNDVLLNDGKLAGILLESAGAAGALDYLAIGIGVNLAATPESVEPRALRPVSLSGETGVQIGAEDFLARLAAAYARREAEFQTGGFAPIRAAWLARAARIGERITARTGQRDISGVFTDVDGAGNLVLQTARGMSAIAAADVFF